MSLQRRAISALVSVAIVFPIEYALAWGTFETTKQAVIVAALIGAIGRWVGLLIGVLFATVQWYIAVSLWARPDRLYLATLCGTPVMISTIISFAVARYRIPSTDQ